MLFISSYIQVLRQQIRGGRPFSMLTMLRQVYFKQHISDLNLVVHLISGSMVWQCWGFLSTLPLYFCPAVGVNFHIQALSEFWSQCATEFFHKIKIHVPNSNRIIFLWIFLLGWVSFAPLKELHQLPQHNSMLS